MASRRGFIVTYGLLAVVAFGCFIALGRVVVAYGEPPALWQWERSLVNQSTLVAWWLTWACYPDALIPLCIVLLIFAWRVPAWRARAVLSIVLLLLCWRGADFSQQVFARPRRIDWVVKHETAFSYPSSHAAVATGFYAFWAVLLYLSDLPKRIRTTGAFLLVLFAVAICWSRLALGAHYLTDLAGGVLLAVALVSAAVTTVPASFLSRVAGRVSGTEE